MTMRVFVGTLAFLTAMPLAQAQLEEFTDLPPVDTTGMESIGTLGPSFYWVAVEKDDGEPRDQKVLDENEKVLAKVSKAFMRNLKLEGTGKLLDGRIINFKSFITLPDGRRDVRYQVCPKSAPYGYGLDYRKLVPFRSVAIDPSVIPMDSILYIPAARGAKLPDGSIHDGMFRAIDIGSAIINRRIDIFTAYGDQSAVFARNGLNHGRQTEIFIVK